MTNQELVFRLTIELYDLKHKLVGIRHIAEEGQKWGNQLNTPDSLKSATVPRFIDIINLIDTEEDYSEIFDD